MGDGRARLLIIADDLTGSNDAGVQFAKRGIKSVVLVGYELSTFPADYEVVVVNTESRHVEPSEAARRVRRVAEAGLRAGVTHFFKKTDSTLRGNIGAELQALMEVTGETSLPFVPAFPEMGRTTRNGFHYVQGVPIAESEFARDPLSPVRESAVSKVLRQTAQFPVSSVSPASAGKQTDTGCVIFDCATREDLTALAGSFQATNKLRVLAGSAAFVEELPGVITFRVQPHEPVAPGAPILFVNGSLNPRALEQVTRVRERLHKIQLLPKDLFAAHYDHPALSRGLNVLLYTVENREEEDRYRAEARGLGLSERAIHLQVADALGRRVKCLLNENAFRTLVVFGGDTLMGIARAMAWPAFVPRAELSPGISIAQPVGNSLLVVSKAGGFGGPDAAERIVDFIAPSRAEG